MWIQKDKLSGETYNEVLDWVVIDGVLWVEVDESMTPTRVCLPLFLGEVFGFK